MTGQTVGFIRVSTLDQNTVRQLEGETLDRVFTDKASGKDQNRPELDALIQYVRDGDTVLVHSMDRLARNLDDLRAIVRRITEKKAQVRFVHENLTFTGDDSPMATLMLSVMGAFAEFERSLIRERQREGIALAKARGVYKGRRKALTAAQAADLVQRAAMGVRRPNSHANSVSAGKRFTSTSGQGIPQSKLKKGMGCLRQWTLQECGMKTETVQLRYSNQLHHWIIQCDRKGPN
jgi:DNA invertase Pin-like site-specific DNA recombinase